jgi:predicted amidophosphoribosyltransferase
MPICPCCAAQIAQSDVACANCGELFPYGGLSVPGVEELPIFRTRRLGKGPKDAQEERAEAPE